MLTIERRGAGEQLVMAGVLLTLALSTSAGAQAPSNPPRGNIRPQILDLKYVIQDLGGAGGAVGAKVHDLEIRETATEIRIAVAADVLFDFDKSELRSDAHETLARAAVVIRANPGAAVRIEGHTDAKGKRAYNETLSVQRAEAVRAWLGGQAGLDTVRFATSGYGSAKPAAPNMKPDGSDDPEGRRRNRRVELVVEKPARDL